MLADWTRRYWPRAVGADGPWLGWSTAVAGAAPLLPGGLIGRFNRDLFMGLGLHRSRAMAEFVLLHHLRAWGLPVPEPLAARRRAWLGWYRADIAVGRVVRPGQDWKAQNLARLLRSLRKEQGRVAGLNWAEADWADLMRGYEAV